MKKNDGLTEQHPREGGTNPREGGTNFRIHHFLPEHIAFNQSALGLFLPESIAPRTKRGYHTIELSSFFAWIPVT